MNMGTDQLTKTRLSMNSICQTCGVLKLQDELVYPFGASTACVCVACMQCIAKRIDRENKAYRRGVWLRYHFNKLFSVLGIR